jgi:hypothetical protein
LSGREVRERFEYDRPRTESSGVVKHAVYEAHSLTTVRPEEEVEGSEPPVREWKSAAGAVVSYPAAKHGSVVAVSWGLPDVVLLGKFKQKVWGPVGEGAGTEGLVNDHI